MKISEIWGKRDMKKLLYFAFFSIFAFFGTVNCETITLNWLNENGTTNQTTTCESGGNLVLPPAPTKTGYDFIGWLANYTPIEYLESTGTQYINTGVILNDNYIQVDLDISQYTPNREYSVLCGSVKGNAKNAVHIHNNTLFINVGAASNIGITNVSRFTPLHINYEFAYGGYKINVNEQNFTGVYSGVLKNDFPVYLFAYNEDNQTTWHTIMKLNGCKIYTDSNTLVRDFIPVIDYNGVPCMFDKVSRQFYYNAGTGDFIAGPVINYQ